MSAEEFTRGRHVRGLCLISLWEERESWALNAAFLMYSSFIVNSSNLLRLDLNS
jgi:hypothetical protein